MASKQNLNVRDPNDNLYESIVDYSRGFTTTNDSSDNKSIEVQNCNNLLDAIDFIFQHASVTDDEMYLVTEEQKLILKQIIGIQHESQMMFKNLQQWFLNYYTIDLRIIDIQGNRFDQIVLPPTEENVLTAILLFDQNKQFMGPLFLRDNNSIKTIFHSRSEDMDRLLYFFLQKLNSSDLSIYNNDEHNVSLQSHQNTTTNVGQMETERNKSLNNDEFQLNIKARVDEIGLLFSLLKIEPSMIEEEKRNRPEKIDFSKLSFEEIPKLLENRIDFLSRLVPRRSDAIKAIIGSLSEGFPMISSQEKTPDISNNQVIEETSQDENALESSTIEKMSYESSEVMTKSNATEILPPTFFGQLVTMHRKRTFGEFGETPSAPITHEGESERSGITVTIPEGSPTPLYLSIAVTNTQYEMHDTIVPVPDKARNIDKSLSNNNDLRCFNFDQCANNEKLLPDSRIMYSEITADEHEKRLKETGVHLITLYQRNGVTKELIQKKDLTKFHVGVSFSKLIDGQFKEVSKRTYSQMIEQTLSSTGKRKKLNET